MCLSPYPGLCRLGFDSPPLWLSSGGTDCLLVWSVSCLRVEVGTRRRWLLVTLRRLTCLPSTIPCRSSTVVCTSTTPCGALCDNVSVHVWQFTPYSVVMYVSHIKGSHSFTHTVLICTYIVWETSILREFLRSLTSTDLRCWLVLAADDICVVELIVGAVVRTVL